MLHHGIIFIAIYLQANFFQVQSFNASACGYIQYHSLYYFVNKAQNDNNVVVVNSSALTTTIYNLCHTLEFWCQVQNKVVTASMIVVSDSACLTYSQSQIKLIDENNSSSGISITYKADDVSTDPAQKVLSYPCSGSDFHGCPQVAKTTLWAYFSENSVTYTIVIEVIGVLFMILGVYMYRITTVIIGWSTAFIVLIGIEQSVVFVPGVPDELLSDVMMLTIICSFFVGYVLAYFPKSGLFCMGMWIGFIISLTLNNIALYLIQSDPPTLALFIVMPVLCLAFGILTIFVKKTFIIFATSLIGAYICLRALSWHLGAFPNEFLYSRQYQLGIEGNVDWQFYLYVIALLVLTASSSALQFWLFKKKSAKNNQSPDIQEHFNKLEDKMEHDRQNLVEFQNVFAGLKQNGFKQPRILKRELENDDDDDQIGDPKKRQKTFSSISMSSEGDSENTEQEQARIEKQRKAAQLHQNLLFKKKRKGNK